MAAGGLGVGAATGALTLGTLGKGAAAAGLAHLGATRAGQQVLTQGLEPAIRALIGRGHAADEVMRVLNEHGPDAVLAMARGEAQ